MIIMAVDYGDVRTGLALCDRQEMLAVPLTVVVERDAEELTKKIDALAKERQVELLVVGLPKNMDGSQGFRAEKCREFAHLLKETTGLMVELWDERCTTLSAHTLLNDTNTRGKKRKAVVDQAAASLILQDFLDYRRLNPTGQRT